MEFPTKTDQQQHALIHVMEQS